MRNFLAEFGDAAIDGQATGTNPFFDRAPRPQAPLGEIFLEPLGSAGRRCSRACHGYFRKP
jgi:hypothetical protein